MAARLRGEALQAGEEVEYALPLLVAAVELGVRDDVPSELRQVLADLHLAVPRLGGSMQGMDRLFRTLHHVPNVSLRR